MELVLKDIRERFVRSRGKGGQNVNKVATCVQLTHIPTGIRVKCDYYRTQGKNRELAYILLAEKLEKLATDKIKTEINIFEKEKRKRRRRSVASKEIMLKDKKLHSEKKSLRKKMNI
jgi:protein subunit release factor B